MSDKENETFVSPPVFPRFPLNTIEQTRRSFARVIRMYIKKKIGREEYRDLVYGLSSYANVFKIQKDLEMADMLNEIQEKLDAILAKGKI